MNYSFIIIALELYMFVLKSGLSLIPRLNQISCLDLWLDYRGFIIILIFCHISLFLNLNKLKLKFDESTSDKQNSLHYLYRRQSADSAVKFFLVLENTVLRRAANFTSFLFFVVVKMANRGGRHARTEDSDNTINYVQCDGLVSYKQCPSSAACVQHKKYT